MARSATGGILRRPRAPEVRIAQSLPPTLSISVVIPVRNEERYIARCIDALLRQEDASLDREIVVVDNGSTDDTVNILGRYGSSIQWYVRPDLSIPGLRNFGVEKSTKEWVAFVDADVEVDRHWARMLIRFLEDLDARGIDRKRVITGSTCLVPDDPTWVEQVWYEQLMVRDGDAARYINCGNLVLHRDLMRRLGGFDLRYKTGEEEKLCEDARTLHAAIVLKNTAMKAVHHGYPKTVGAFFQRMRWHGRGMARYLFRPWKSRPLLLALYYLLTTGLYLGAAAASGRYLYCTTVYLALQVAPAVALAAGRYRGSLKNASLLAFLYGCFGWARAISLFDMLRRKEVLQKK